jgi:hypothetical protein
MGIGRFSRQLRGVGVLTIPDKGLDATRHIESIFEAPPAAGVLQLLVSGVVVGVFIESR